MTTKCEQASHLALSGKLYEWMRRRCEVKMDSELVVCVERVNCNAAIVTLMGWLATSHAFPSH